MCVCVHVHVCACVRVRACACVCVYNNLDQRVLLTFPVQMCLYLCEMKNSMTRPTGNTSCLFS